MGGGGGEQRERDMERPQATKLASTYESNQDQVSLLVPLHANSTCWLAVAWDVPGCCHMGPPGRTTWPTTFFFYTLYCRLVSRVGPVGY